MNEAVRKVFKPAARPDRGDAGVRLLVCVRWYAAYPLSLRQIEGMKAERSGSRTRRGGRSRNDSPLVYQDDGGHSKWRFVGANVQ